jgi:hypothetical protein
MLQELGEFFEKVFKKAHNGAESLSKYCGNAKSLKLSVTVVQLWPYVNFLVG